LAIYICFFIVLSSSNWSGYMICLLALGAGSTKLIEVSATITYYKTSVKLRVFTFIWFWTTWNISRRYCKSVSLKLTHCFLRYNLATPLVPFVFDLKSPFLHTYYTLPHMDSHILGRHSAILLPCWWLRMMKVDPLYLQLQILRRVGSLDWGKNLRRNIWSCLCWWKRHRSRTLFGSNIGLMAST